MLHALEEPLEFYRVFDFSLCANDLVLQKALNLPPGKIFKVCKPSSTCCKIGLSKLKIRMNLLRMNHYFLLKEGMISGIDHHLLFFYVSV